MTTVDLDAAFDQLAATLDQAVRERNFATTSSVAETLGLRKIGDGKPSQRHVWERPDGDLVLRFEWRWYDQSKAFSTQPDMNLLSVSLLRGEQTVKTASDRYED